MQKAWLRVLTTAVLACALIGDPAAFLDAGADEPEAGDESVLPAARALLSGEGAEVVEALERLRARGHPEVAAGLILALRYNPMAAPGIEAALRAVTGHDAGGWFDWMVWQERHPEIRPHESYTRLKQELLAAIDPRFLQFLYHPWVEPGRMSVRLEEIVWGGVPVDGIPPLDDPLVISAGEARYLNDDDLVFGVEIDGEARAYPLRILGWHEMVNDEIGGVPVALAYCTLCGSGILYDRRVEGRGGPLTFSSSGLLHRSNKLMYDRETKSLWLQFTGEPVVGPMTEQAERLTSLPLVTARWDAWRSAHPETGVLALDTGFERDYGPGVAYREYFASPDLLFPATTDPDAPLAPKDRVFGIATDGTAKAWPLEAFAGGAVINDWVGDTTVVLIGAAAGRTVRAYERGGLAFRATDRPESLAGPGGAWQVTEAALVGPDGRRLVRIPGRVAFWFAWNSALGQASELYLPD